MPGKELFGLERMAMIKRLLHIIFLYPAIFFGQCDTSAFAGLLRQSESLCNTKPEAALELSLQAVKKARSCGDVYWMARTAFSAGQAFDYRNQADSAEVYYGLYLNYARELKDSVRVAEAYNMIGSVYIYKAEYPQALAYCLKGLRLAEAFKSDRIIAGCQGNIGNIYYFQKKYEQALKYWKMSLVVYKRMNNMRNIIIILANIGAYYNEVEDFDNALLYLNESLDYTIKQNDKHGAMSAYTNLGNAYLYQSKYGESISYYQKAKALALELDDKYNLLYCLNNLGDIYINIRKYAEAEKLYKQALELEREFPYPQARLSANYGLFLMNDSIKNYKEAVHYLLTYKNLKDSVLNTENQEQINELETKYQTDKKEQENKLLQAKNDLSEETIKNQQKIALYLVCGIALTMVLAIVVYRSYRLKKRDNAIITAQKNEMEMKNAIIEHQKNLVEEKQKEIIDSIQYARRIQQSLLPHEKAIQKALERMRRKS